jgi:hypothetical protein
MTRQKKSRLKSISFSFKDRGRLSQNKDPEVQYITHIKKRGRGKKVVWKETCADPLFEPSEGVSRSSSPRKLHSRQPGVNQDEWYREVDGDFAPYAENERRKTKVRPSCEI